jgi:glycosyl transferase family 25
MVFDIPGTNIGSEIPFKIFVISLPSETARRHQIARNLSSLGLEFEFLDAINGATLGSNDYSKYSAKEARAYIGRDLTLGEIGCALSHLCVYSRILEEKLESALILEDDAVLLNDFPKVLQEFLESMINFEVVNFITDAPEIGTKKFILNGYEITDLPFYSNRTTAYLVSRIAAKKLLEVGVPIRTSADGLLGEAALHGLKLTGVYPNLATLYPFESTINPGEYSVGKVVKDRKKRSPKFWRGRWYVLKSSLR